MIFYILWKWQHLNMIQVEEVLVESSVVKHYYLLLTLTTFDQESRLVNVWNWFWQWSVITGPVSSLVGEAQLSICVITQPELKKLSWSHSDRAPSKLHWLMSQKLEIILVMESPLVPVTHKTKWLSLFWVWTADTETRVM